MGPTSFARTMRALDADGTSPALLAVILVAGLGGVWTCWLVAARVPVYQLSETARLEVERVHPMAASVAGRVVATELVLGREVRQGDVLVEVESERERTQTTEERSHLSALTGQATALEGEIGDEQQALEGSRRAAQAALTEASQKAAALEAAVRQAEDKFTRLERLAHDGLSAAAEVEIARADLQARRADYAAARAGVDRLRAEQLAAERDRRGRIASLMREKANLDGLKNTSVSTVASREREADRRRIRAPLSGRLGEVNNLQVGSLVTEGEHLASIIPEGQVRVVAEFPAPALGRLKAGQAARVRLDGFPWAEYGHVDARVTEVASETRDQRVHVELTVLHENGLRIPLQHGMPGAVEVEVERAAPLALIIRSLGQGLTGSPSAPAEPGRTAEAQRP
jgi:multidrug resistance efflux pump